MANLCVHVPNCIWTKALLDGSVKVYGFDVVFEAAVFDQRGSSRLRGDVEDKYAATEQVIPDYLLRIARGTEAELVALTFAIVVINSWNRLSISFRPPVGSYQPAAAAPVAV